MMDSFNDQIAEMQRDIDRLRLGADAVSIALAKLGDEFQSRIREAYKRGRQDGDTEILKDEARPIDKRIWDISDGVENLKHK
jgi:hypothetical protein